MWGEWIEIDTRHRCGPLGPGSLPVWGEWIEIARENAKKASAERLSPCGESGLKSKSEKIKSPLVKSLPVWGEWIEIFGQRRDLGGRGRLSPCGESGLK